MTAPSPRHREISPADWRSRTGLKVFIILLVASAFASVAILPYSLTLTGAGQPEMALWLLVVLSVVPNLILIAPICALGLWLGPKVGLGAPWLYAWIEGRPDARRTLRRYLPLAVGVGAVTGVVIVLGALAFAPWLPEELGQTPVPSWWQGLLASASAGITEELLLRLGLMTLLVWLGAKLTRQDCPSSATVWAANALAALAFGAGHLPLAASLVPLTTMMVVRTLALNGVAGIVFGWLYWRYGLLAAMVAHMSTDVVLHVLTPLLVAFAQ